MSSKALLSISSSSVAGFAAASVVAGILLSAVGQANATPVTQLVAANATSAEFDGLPADTYTFTAVPVDANSNPLTSPNYSPPSANLVVPADTTVSLSVPSNLAASLG